MLRAVPTAAAAPRWRTVEILNQIIHPADAGELHLLRTASLASPASMWSCLARATLASSRRPNRHGATRLLGWQEACHELKSMSAYALQPRGVISATQSAHVLHHCSPQLNNAQADAHTRRQQTKTHIQSKQTHKTNERTSKQTTKQKRQTETHRCPADTEAHKHSNKETQNNTHTSARARLRVFVVRSLPRPFSPTTWPFPSLPKSISHGPWPMAHGADSPRGGGPQHGVGHSRDVTTASQNGLTQWTGSKTWRC